MSETFLIKFCGKVSPWLPVWWYGNLWWYGSEAPILARSASLPTAGSSFLARVARRMKLVKDTTCFVLPFSFGSLFGYKYQSLNIQIFIGL